MTNLILAEGDYNMLLIESYWYEKNPPRWYIKQPKKIAEDFEILIPRDRARGVNVDYDRLDRETVEQVDHYTLYVRQQPGSRYVRKDTDVYFKLPKSNMTVRIILYMDGGVNFDPKFHKYIIRETDELDRRIILGFCKKYQNALVNASHGDDWDAENLKHHSLFYRATDMPKRIKTGSENRDSTDFYRKLNLLQPYDENNNIFKNVRII